MHKAPNTNVWNKRIYRYGIDYSYIYSLNHSEILNILSNVGWAFKWEAFIVFEITNVLSMTCYINFYLVGLEKLETQNT